MKPLRIGYVVHGFGVPHAHLNVLPMHDPSDILSARHIVPTADRFAISTENLDKPDRSELDRLARLLA